MPLTGLDQVDWSHIHHSHGTAEKFPKWLEALVSDDDLAWADEMDVEVTVIEADLDESTLEKPNAEIGDRLAFQNLSRYSIHQGSIYEVTPYVIRFFNQILGMVSPERQRLLLFTLAGYAYGQQSLNENNEMMREIYKNQKLDFEGTVKRAKQAFDDTRSQLRKALPLYAIYLADSHLKIREAAVELVASIGDFAPEARQILAVRLKIETDENIREQIAKAIA